MALPNPPVPLLSAISQAAKNAATKFGVSAQTLEQNLVGIWHIESASHYPNPYVNKAGYGGLFGTTNGLASTQAQADEAASVLATGLQKSGGNVSEALSYYNSGKLVGGYTSVPGVPAGGGSPVATVRGGVSKGVSTIAADSAKLLQAAAADFYNLGYSIKDVTAGKVIDTHQIFEDVLAQEEKPTTTPTFFGGKVGPPVANRYYDPTLTEMQREALASSAANQIALDAESGQNTDASFASYIAQETGRGGAGNLELGGVIAGITGVGNAGVNAAQTVAGGATSVLGEVGKLTSTSTWERALYVIGGGVLLLAGLAIIAREIGARGVPSPVHTLTGKVTG